MNNNNNNILNTKQSDNNKKLPFEIKHSDFLGRYLVTNKDLKAGEPIIIEEPLIVGPRVNSSAICLNCYKSLFGLKPFICPNCNVIPICNPNCKISNSLIGHSTIECNLFKSRCHLISTKNVLENLQVILPLRCVLLKNINHDLWNELMKLEGHIEKRRNTPIWMNYQLKIIKLLREWNLINDDISDDLIQKVMSIVDVNCFEARIPRSNDLGDMPVTGDDCVRALYLKGALMSHDCISNTHVSIDDQFNLSVRCSIDLKSDQTISFNYTNALMGTFERQEHLREGKYFECNCDRCTDSTELGTHLSSILCSKCKTGYVDPIDTNYAKRYTPKLNWKCGNCQKLYCGSLMRITIDEAKAQFENIDKSEYKQIETLLSKLLKTLPKENFIVIDVKQSLIAAYRDVLRRDMKPTKYILQRKLELCKDLLPLLDKIQPGISRLKGITQYEMHIPLVILSNREYETGDISADVLLSKLMEAEQMVRNAIRLLLYEPKSSPEGRLARQAFDELRMLGESISNVKQIVNINIINKSNNKSKQRRKRNK